jgi:hypothetical protein
MKYIVEQLILKDRTEFIDTNFQVLQLLLLDF